MIGLLKTGAGFWNPLVWLAALLVTALAVYVIRSRGSKKYRPGTGQTMPFFSGNRPPEDGIKSGNMYWGFFEALKRYYKWMRRLHTGIVNDYVFIYVLVMVLLMAAITLGGLL